jgi:hypothetical protein
MGTIVAAGWVTGHFADHNRGGHAWRWWLVDHDQEVQCPRETFDSR